MTVQSFGTLLIVVGISLAIVLGILIALGVIPLFGDYKRMTKGPARKDAQRRPDLS